MRLPQPTLRNVGAVLASILVVTFVAVYVTTPGAPTEEAKVSRLLQRAASTPAEEIEPAGKGSDSPTAGVSRKRKRSIFVTPERGRTARIGRLEVPAIGLSASFREGVFDAVVERGPGHWPGTPLPGNAGNSVFAGHRTTFTKPFADLDLLRKGDAIRATVGKGDRLTYRVFQVTVVPEAEYADFVLRQPTEKRARMITLFACTPKGSRTHRIVVKAKAERLPTTPADEEQGRGDRV
jgi:sortase A